MSKSLKKLLKKLVVGEAQEQLAVADAKLGSVIKVVMYSRLFDHAVKSIVRSSDRCFVTNSNKCKKNLTVKTVSNDHTTKAAKYQKLLLFWSALPQYHCAPK